MFFNQENFLGALSITPFLVPLDAERIRLLY